MSTAVRFSVDEYDRMVSQGVFDDRRDCRMELIQGEIRETTPPNPPHEDVVDLLSRWSFENVPNDEVRVRIQNSIGIPELDSVPMPDVVWVREQSYRTGRPQPTDVLLLIEVSETTLRFDRGGKAELYASAGIADYWVVNLSDECIEVFRNPHNGEYREKQTFEMGQVISPLAYPAVSIKVADLFPES